MVPDSKISISAHLRAVWYEQDENKDVLPVINVNITEEREEHGGNDYGSYLSSTSNFRKPMSP